MGLGSCGAGIVVALLLTSPRIDAQPVTDVELALRCDFDAGESYAYDLYRSSTEFEHGQSVSSSVARTPFTVTVLDRTAEDLRLDWEFGKPEVLELSGHAEAARASGIGSLVEEVVSQPMRFVTRSDVQLSALSLENGASFVRELEAQMRAVMDVALEPLQGRDDMQPVLEQVEATVAQFVGNRQIVEAITLEYPTMILSLACGTYRVGEPEALSGHFVNPFGGAPLPSRGTRQVAVLDRAAGFAVIDTQQAPVAAEAARIFEETLIGSAAQLNITPAQVKTLAASVELRERMRSTIELASGWPTSQVHDRETVIMRKRTVEKTEFKQRD